MPTFLTHGHKVSFSGKYFTAIQFGVDENGTISNVSTTGNKIGHGLEEEAIRVVSKMPKWTAGQVKGKNVKTWRTLPISYRLEG